jgi:putative ABC transport system permease protein
MVVLALGFGAFLLATLFLVQQNLLRDLRLGGGGRPNLVLFDIQPGQRDGVDSVLQASGLRVEAPVPIVPMRIARIRGRNVSEWLADTTGGEDRPERWALRREYRSTWRDTLVRSEQAVEGDAWPPAGEPGGVVPISMEVELADDLGVRVGDPVDWDVQGVVIRSRIAGLREVDWARFEPNFFVVFPSGVLEAAPHSYVTLTRVADSADVGRIQSWSVNVSGSRSTMVPRFWLARPPRLSQARFLPTGTHILFQSSLRSVVSSNMVTSLKVSPCRRRLTLSQVKPRR